MNKDNFCLFSNILFIYFALLDLSCSMWNPVPHQGSNLGPLHWTRGVSGTEPPEKSQDNFLF